MEEAGGVGIGVTKTFDNISVDGNALEIDLNWAGKGTTSVPDREVYRPLISAIDITSSNFASNSTLSTVFFPLMSCNNFPFLL